jgi:hypothetical protein
LDFGLRPDVPTVCGGVFFGGFGKSHVVCHDMSVGIKSGIEEVKTWNIKIFPEIEQDKIDICVELLEQIPRVTQPELYDIRKTSSFHLIAGIVLFVGLKFERDHAATGRACGFRKP